MKINFAYWLHLYKDKPLPKMKQHTKAIVAHHFNLHTWCGPWCKWLPEHDVVPVQSAADKKKYRCVKKNKEMYDLCNKKLEPYLKDDKLEQCCHGYNTQNNKGIHNAINFTAPNNIDYSCTNSLKGQISIPCGIQSEGLDKFFYHIN